MGDTIADRLRGVLDRIAAAQARAGRAPGSVTLCAVTKTFPASLVAEAAAAGVTDVGENRVQEAESKRPAVAAPLAWHLIGHLQGNKVRRAVQLFDVIESVDSLRLAERVDRVAGELGRNPAVYIQVDLAREPTKTGAPAGEVSEIATALDRAEHARLAGLMTVPPLCDDPEDVRPYFRRLRALRDELNALGRLSRPLAGLSMGMSHDFEIAVEEGATVVRVGSAIFGARG
jgi:pyridoxal phosphate enzyme (YggS family)